MLPYLVLTPPADRCISPVTCEVMLGLENLASENSVALSAVMWSPTSQQACQGVMNIGEVGEALTSEEVCECAELLSWKLQGGLPALGHGLGLLHSVHVDIKGRACVAFCLLLTVLCARKLTICRAHPSAGKHPRKQSPDSRGEHHKCYSFITLLGRLESSANLILGGLKK